MGTLNHRAAVYAIIKLLIMHTSQATEGTVATNIAKGPVGGVTQRKPVTPPHPLASTTAGATAARSPPTMPKANTADQMNKDNQSSKQSGYVTITNNPGPLAKIFLDLFGFSQNPAQAPVSVKLEFSSNPSRVPLNGTLHEEKGNAVDLLIPSRQNAASTIVKAVSPTSEVNQTNRTSAFVKDNLKGTSLDTTSIRPWVWIFGISSLVVASCGISAVILRMGATHGSARQPDDPPSSASEQSNDRQVSHGTTVLYLQNTAEPIGRETGTSSGHLNHDTHVFSDHLSGKTDAFQNPVNDMKVVAESFAGNGQPIPSQSLNHLIIPA